MNMNRIRWRFGLLLAAASIGAAAQAPAGTSAVARLGEASVSQDELQRLLQGLPEAERAALKGQRAGVEQWLRQRLTSEAVLREARAKGWADRPEVKARVDAAVKEITSRIVAGSYLESVSQVPAGYPSDAEVQAAYEQGKAGFQLPAAYRVAQIYLATPDASPAAVAKVRETAARLAREARSGDFAALARAHSQDARSAAQGGEVGSLPLASLLPEAREVVAKLKPGQVSEAVQAADGFHVLKLLDTQPARVATLDEMRPQLQALLRQQRQQQLLQSHLAGLAPADALRIDSAALDAVLSKTH